MDEREKAIQILMEVPAKVIANGVRMEAPYIGHIARGYFPLSDGLAHKICVWDANGRPHMVKKQSPTVTIPRLERRTASLEKENKAQRKVMKRALKQVEVLKAKNEEQRQVSRDMIRIIAQRAKRSKS